MLLYKYFEPARRNFFENLLVRFTQPSAFNDPFECIPQIKGFDNPKVIEQIVRQSVEEHRKSKKIDHLPLEERIFEEGRLAEYGRDLAQRIAANPEKLTDLYLKPLFQEISEAKGTFGVFCMSDRFDSVTMWSHYAANHNGFVVGFETETDFFAKRPGEFPEIGEVRKVEYSNTRPCITVPIADTDSTPDIFFIKNDEWSYEREWRILRWLKDADSQPKPGVFLFAVPPKTIGEIIFGSRAEESFVKSTLAMIRQNPALQHAKIKKAQLSRDKYTLVVSDFKE